MTQPFQSSEPIQKVAIMKSTICYLIATIVVFKLITDATAQDTNCTVDQICFALDQSGSIDDAEYAQEQAFVVNITKAIQARSPNPFFSAYAFDFSSAVIQSSTNDVDGVFIPAINGDRLLFSGTSLEAGLQSCFDEIRSKKGNRVIALVTDGQALNPTDLVKQIKGDGISILTVGIGDGVDEVVLKDIASAPNFFFSSTFDKLPAEVVTIAEGACNAVDVNPSPDVEAPSSAPIGTGCGDAYDACEFQFSGEIGLSTYDVMQPQDQAFTPQIISKDSSIKLAVLNTNGIVPEFIDGLVVQPITDFASPRFTPTHFKPFSIPNAQGSGVGHQTYDGDQQSMAKNRCVRVFFTSFQVLDSITGSVKDNFNDVPKEMNKCVVFRS